MSTFEFSTRPVGIELEIPEISEDLLLLAEDYRRVKSWGEQRDVLTQQGFASVALDSLRLHGWRASNTDGGKRSKFQFLNDGLVKGIHY